MTRSSSLRATTPSWESEALSSQVGRSSASPSLGLSSESPGSCSSTKPPAVTHLPCDPCLALDAESEHQVQKALDELIKSGQQTIVVIAHRLSTIRDADEIIVVRKGEIVEKGSHDELLKLGGVYKSLVERQLMSMQLDEEDK